MFACTVYPATGAVLAVVGDGRSGDPLHERGDKRDVYEGEVAEVDSVSELIRRVDGVVDGLRSLVGAGYRDIISIIYMYWNLYWYIIYLQRSNRSSVRVMVWCNRSSCGWSA